MDCCGAPSGAGVLGTLGGSGAIMQQLTECVSEYLLCARPCSRHQGIGTRSI